MCLALPDGNRSNKDHGRFKRLLAWIGFGALLVRILVVGLWQSTAKRCFPQSSA